jgi:hypothetical protein
LGQKQKSEDFELCCFGKLKGSRGWIEDQKYGWHSCPVIYIAIWMNHSNKSPGLATGMILEGRGKKMAAFFWFKEHRKQRESNHTKQKTKVNLSKNSKVNSKPMGMNERNQTRENDKHNGRAEKKRKKPSIPRTRVKDRIHYLRTR